ncbi:MAG: type II toxin-antitoxin system RelE/ParE family toxin [Spirochaetota bacterium]|nr:type II toxin-antitoxin system RelE/ParE family toxin [Spirochaetota bacterium]
MRYSFHSSAKKELIEAVNYYKGCLEGLGLEFTKEVYSTIIRIIQFPEAWSKLSKNTRRCLTNRFPYGIIYQKVEDEIYIIGVMQMNREPYYWKDRL